MTERRVAVWIDNARYEGTIESEHLSSTGLMKVRLDDGMVVARHKDRVEPLNKEAREFVTGSERSYD